MKALLFISVVFLCTVAKAQEKNFAVSGVSPALLENAHAIKRMEETSFQIINTGETILTHKWAITVLDQKGEEHSQLVEFYDKLTSIKSIEGSLFDAGGKRLKSIKKKEISDHSAVGENNLIDDNRVKTHRFHHTSYPYTVQYEVVTKIHNTIFFPTWQPQEAEQLSVEQSSFLVICPIDYQVRYKSFQYAGDPVVITEKNKKLLRWEISNIPAIKRFFAAPSWRELTTTVYLAPTDFEIQGYKGNMSSWQEMGKFQYALNQKRDVLPEKVLHKIRELTAGLSSDRDKVNVLYEYLQSNTRYVSIQLGLGGWQPFEASYVATKGYGDCKALTNYMHSLLKAAGIYSNYVLVNAGEDRQEVLMEDFPSRLFNHALLCVPLQKDSIWLECTSSSNAAGYVGGFTANRKALLINENGGVLVNTPSYGIRENILKRKIVGSISVTGELNMTVNTWYGGVQQDDLNMLVKENSDERMNKVLQQSLDLSTYRVNRFHYSGSEKGLPELKEDLEVTAPGFATISGKRIFIKPNILNCGGNLLEEDRDRKIDFVFHKAFSDLDDYEIEIPEGYQLESLPQEVSISSVFGNYFSSVKLQGNKIIYHRSIEKFAGRYPAALQSDLIRFYGDIYRADRNKVVLVKKN